MRLAIIFPGQGAQAPCLGAPWRDHPAWSIVDEATELTGVPFAHLLLDAGPEELAETSRSQLVVLAASLLAWRAAQPLLADDIVGVAGHSLGQITALVTSRSVDLVDGLRLAVARAAATADAQRHRPGGLLALLGADEVTARAACAAVDGPAWVANRNAPGQVVVGAPVEVLEPLAAAATDAGARRVVRLGVDGAFHTPLMAPAADALAPLLADTAFAPGHLPVVANDDARVVAQPHEWPQRLRTHLVAPVRWQDSLDALVRLGADGLVEVGPGTTLTALARRSHPALNASSIATPDDLAALAAPR